MITFEQALGWLSYESSSKLSPGNAATIQSMRQGPERESNTLCDNLLDYAYREEAPVDQAEVIAFCAIYYYERGRFDDALNQFDAALNLFDEERDYHRQALLECMISHIFCNRSDQDAGFEWLQKAFRHFLNRSTFYFCCGNAGRVKWYADRMEEIAYEVLSTPETTYKCLYEFDGSCLSPSAMHILSQIDQRIHRNQFDEALEELAGLRRITWRSPEYKDTAEGFAFSGLKMAQMDRMNQAVYDLRCAISHCTPAGHNQVFMRWMLALIQLRKRDQHCYAVENIEMCISHIQGLIQAADRQDQYERRTWYEVYQKAMRRIADQRFSNLTIDVRVSPAPSPSLPEIISPSESGPQAQGPSVQAKLSKSIYIEPKNHET